MDTSQEQAEYVQVSCRACRRATEHAVLRKLELAEVVDDGEGLEYREWQIVRCQGCKNHAFREGWSWNGDFDDQTGKRNWQWAVYPKPQVYTEGVDALVLPESVCLLYTETLIAFNQGAPMLAAAGLRAVVKAICEEQRCTEQRLDEQIDELVRKGVFLERDADYFHSHHLLGTEAVHEMKVPPEAEFELALRMLEHLLNTVYSIPLLDRDLRELRQGRKAELQ